MMEIILEVVAVVAGLWILKTVLSFLANLGGVCVILEILGEAFTLSSGSLPSNRKRERFPDKNYMVDDRF